MSATNTEQGKPKQQLSVLTGLLLYAGYLAVFFTTWTVNGVDYQRIGENVKTTKLWYPEFPKNYKDAGSRTGVSCLGGGVTRRRKYSDEEGKLPTNYTNLHERKLSVGFLWLRR